MPLVINKEVTIEAEPGAERAVLISRAAGIVLGADVTFQNLELDFANPYHDQVFANGYSLSLINVSRNEGHRLIDIAAGGLYGADGVQVGPASGKNGRVLIQGRQSAFGNVYAGSINGGFEGSVSISICDVSSTAVGGIYASGAKEAEFDRDQWFNTDEPPAPEPDAAAYPVAGKVNLVLDKASVKNIDGAGAVGGLEVSFSTEYRSDTVSFRNVAKLTLSLIHI